MGAWRIEITGTGPSQNGVDDDVERMVDEFVDGKLRTAHTVKSAKAVYAPGTSSEKTVYEYGGPGSEEAAEPSTAEPTAELPFEKEPVTPDDVDG